MSGYTVALYIHLCALFLAFGMVGATALAMTRLRRARVCSEALQWLAIGKTTGIVFPIVLVTLLASGAYMVHDQWSWGTPWIDAGLTGVVFLGVVGDRLEGGRASRIASVLAADPNAPVAGATAAALRDPLFWSAVAVNPCIALAVAFDMANKPGPIGAGAALAVALVVGSTMAVPLWHIRTEEQPATTAAE